MPNPISERMAAKRAGISAGVQAEPKAPKVLRLPFYQEILTADIQRLKKLATVEEKKAVKINLLDKYDIFIDDYIAMKHNYRNAVAVQVMIWLFDVMNLEKALRLAFVLVDQEQPMPANFGRDMPTFVCDSVYDWANALWKEKKSASPYLDWLVEKLPAWDDMFKLHPAVISKNYVMLAKHKSNEGEYQAVVDLCTLAEAANPEGHGSKTLKLTAAIALKAAR